MKLGLPNLFEDWAAIALVAALYLETLCFGGNRVDLSLVFTALQGGVLAAVLSTPWGKRGLNRLVELPLMAALFGLALIGVIIALIPLPFGGHLIWRAVGRPPRAAIFPFGVLIELSKLLGYACAFTTAAIITSDRRRGDLIMKALVLAGLGFSLVCLILEGLSPTDVFGWTKPGIAAFRVSGVFSSANTAATVFGVNAILATGSLLHATERSRREKARDILLDLLKFSPMSIASFILSLGCLLLSASRGGVAAFALAFIVLVGSQAFGSGGKHKNVWVVIGAMALGLIALSGGFLSQRFANAAFATDARPQWALATWGLFLTSPVMGFGLGALPALFKARAGAADFDSLIWAGSAHNVYLQWLAEGGLLASLPTLALLMVWFRNTSSALRGGSGTSVWRRSITASVILVLAHSLFEYSLEEPSIAIFFSLLMGAGLGLASLRPRSRRRAIPVDPNDAAALAKQSHVEAV